MISFLLLASTLSTYEIQQFKQPLVPPQQLPLGGYTERGDHLAEPGGEALYAHTLILSQGKTSVALVSFEGLTVPESLYREVQKRVDIPVFLVATHTHCAPDTQMLNDRMTLRIPGIASYKREWLEWYSLKIAGGISIAQQQPVHTTQVDYSMNIVNLARSRRKGTSVTNQLTRVFDMDRYPLITVFGAHATCYDAQKRQTNGDWPGALMEQVGGLVFPGAIGNASPNVDDSAENRAELMANAIRRAPFERLNQNLNGLIVIREKVKLDPVSPHPDFAREYKVNDALAQIAVSKFAPTSAFLNAVVLGDLILLGVPGEPVGDLEARIQTIASQRGYKVAVVSHCNGWIGYILEAYDYKLGGYEATLSFHGAKTAQRVFEASQSLINKLPNRAKGAY